MYTHICLIFKTLKYWKFYDTGKWTTTSSLSHTNCISSFIKIIHNVSMLSQRGIQEANIRNSMNNSTRGNPAAQTVTTSPTQPMYTQFSRKMVWYCISTFKVNFFTNSLHHLKSRQSSLVTFPLTPWERWQLQSLSHTETGDSYSPSHTQGQVTQQKGQQPYFSLFLVNLPICF